MMPLKLELPNPSFPSLYQNSQPTASAYTLIEDKSHIIYMEMM